MWRAGRCSGPSTACSTASRRTPRRRRPDGPSGLRLAGHAGDEVAFLGAAVLGMLGLGARLLRGRRRGRGPCRPAQAPREGRLVRGFAAQAITLHLMPEPVFVGDLAPGFSALRRAPRVTGLERLAIA